MEKISKRNERVILACVLSIAICLIAFMYIHYGNKNEDFAYNEHLDETVMSIMSQDGAVESMNVNLQEMAYYIINVEGDINDMAYQYDSENPKKYWTVKIRTIYNMADYAKDLAFDSCVRDFIYYMEAVKAGLELTEEELELAADDTKVIMKNLSGKQMDMSDYSEEILYSLEKKLYLATKYVNTLTEKGYKIADLELDGSYYQELLSLYNIDVNEEVWDKIELGELTIEN